MLPKPLAAALLTAFALPVVATQDYQFDFWPLEGARKDPRFLELREGPYGSVAIAKVRSIPGRNDKAFESEAVFELSTDSRILRRWQLPVNASLVAVQGTVLLFQHGLRTYRTTTTGAVEAARPLPPSTEIVEAQCKMPKVFEGSAYARCWAVPRVGKQARVILALQAPCT